MTTTNQTNAAATNTLAIEDTDFSAEAVIGYQQALSIAIEAGKAGDIESALEHSAIALAQAPDDNRTAIITRGWAIYRALRQLTFNGQDQAPEGLDAIRPLIHELTSDILPQLPRPDLLFSLALSECCRFSRHIPAILLCLPHLGSLQFREDDFKRYYPQNNHTENGFDSLVEKLITRIHKAIKMLQADPSIPSEELTDLLEWSETFIERYIDRFPNQEWFPYYLSIIKIKLGKHEEARQGIVSILMQKPDEFWAWEQFGFTFSDPQTRIACLCRALHRTRAPKAYLVKIRARLAKLLKDEGKVEEARTEAALTVAIRLEKGWNVSPELELFAGDRTDFVQDGDNRKLYEEYAPQAEKALFKDSSDRLIHYRGELTCHPKGFGFVNMDNTSIFLPPQLLSHAKPTDHSNAAGLAIREKRPDGKEGWKAITIDKEM